MSELSEGTEFDSFESLNIAVKRWEKQNFVNLYTRCSRSLKAAQKRAPKRTFKPDLIHFSIDFACVHGGRKHKPCIKTGSRPNQRTLVKGCPFRLLVRATDDGQRLRVTKIDDVSTHNHELRQSVFQFMSKQRKLSEAEQQEVASMIKLKANRKLIQNHLQKSTGKKVVMKDLHNIGSHCNVKENDLQELVNHMNSLEGAAVEVIVDDSENLLAIYFQTKEMKETFNAYPELLLLDATYKLNDLRMPLYVLMNVDGNGESEIICFWLAAFEDKRTISALMEIFKENNAQWEKINVIMADKDMTERQVLTEKLPNAEILICLYHTLRSLRREITMDKLGISLGERNLALEIFGKMAYAATEEEYQTLFQDMEASVPKSIKEYFTANWHDIRHQWVDGLKNQTANFMNRTNNRLESTNQKLKSVISRYSGLTVFFEDLMKCVNHLKCERDYRAANLELKSPVLQERRQQVHQDYYQYLTPYAYGFLKEQLDSHHTTNIIRAIDDNSVMVKSRKYGEMVTSCDNCNCSFNKSMLLPCRHIFAARKHLGKTLFDPDLCSQRWSTEHFKKSHRIFQNISSNDDEDLQQAATSIADDVIISPCRPGKSLTEHQKYRKAFAIAQSIAQIISEQGMDEYRQNLQVLDQLKTMLNARKNVAIIEFVESFGINEEDVETVSVIDVEPSVTNEEQVEGSTESDVITQVTQTASTNEGSSQSSGVAQRGDAGGLILSALIHQTTPASSSVPKSDVVIKSSNAGINEEDVETVSVIDVEPSVTNEEQVEGSTESDVITQVTHTDSTNEGSSQSSGVAQRGDAGGLILSALIHQTTPASSSVPKSDVVIKSSNAGSANTDSQEVRPDLSEIKLPLKMVKRGRPKGAGMTVIGLPKKRIKKGGPVAFRLRSPTEKETTMLSWFVDPNVVQKIIRNDVLVEEHEVESRPECIPMKCIDKSVSIHAIRKYFKFDAWLVVEGNLNFLQDRNVWLCGDCHRNLGESDSICCDSCLDWYHLKCVHKKKAPKRRTWFCTACYAVESR